VYPHNGSRSYHDKIRILKRKMLGRLKRTVQLHTIVFGNNPSVGDRLYIMCARIDGYILFLTVYNMIVIE